MPDPAAPAPDPVSVCTRYLETIAAGGDFGELVDPEIIVEILPNRVSPAGARSDLAAMHAGAARGRQLLRGQHFQVQRAHAAGPELAVLEVTWTGELAVAFGGLPAGAHLRARCALVFELRAGRIVRQRNYDCYDPF